MLDVCEIRRSDGASLSSLGAIVGRNTADFRLRDGLITYVCGHNTNHVVDTMHCEDT
jgi:hypothetical protein